MTVTFRSVHRRLCHAHQMRRLDPLIRCCCGRQNMFVCGGLVWMPYAFLIEVTMLLMVLMTYPFLYSFLALRINQPDVPRAFKIPGGMPGTRTRRCSAQRFLMLC